MRSLALALLGGCSFSHGTLVAGDDAPPDGTQLQSDAPADAAPSCLAKWHDGTIRFATPTKLTAMSSSTYDRDPFVSADELTFYVSSARTGTLGSDDVFRATRAAKTDAWSAPVTVPLVSSTSTESKFSTTSDGLYAVLGSDRTGSLYSIDVWETSRSSLTADWAQPVQTNVAAVNSYSDDHDPTISADGLHLYLAPTSGTQHIVVASRASRGDPFGAPVTISELNTQYGEGDPSLSADELIITFSSNRPTSTQNGNIWYAVRDSLSGTWHAPQPLTDLNSNAAEGDATLSSDGCRVYFARDGGSSWDIYVAEAL